MNYEKVVIKQIPDDSSSLFGLQKYKRSKMPSTMESLPATLGPDNRYITGIDEEAYELRLIVDKTEKEQKKKEIKELREYLQTTTGNTDLSATSPFWDTFRIQISSDNDLILNRSNPMDVIRYHVLVANGYAAPDEKTAATPKYVHCKFVCFVEERQETEDISTFRKRDIARGELVKLSEDNDHLLLVLQYLVGDKVKKGMKEDTLYRIGSEYINDKDSENMKRFMKAASADVEELQFKIAVDRAIKKRIIRFKEGYYQRGQVTFGKSLVDVYSNLKKPEFATEFLSIQEELEGK